MAEFVCLAEGHAESLVIEAANLRAAVGLASKAFDCRPGKIVFAAAMRMIFTPPANMQTRVFLMQIPLPPTNPDPECAR